MAQQNIEIGPCTATFGEADLGRTLGPVRLQILPIWRDRRSDRFGAGVVERVLVGGRVRITLRLAEKTLVQLQAALPQAGVEEALLTLGRTPGLKASAAADTLRLHPEERGDDGRDVLIHRAAPEGAVEIAYGPARSRAFEVAFEALIDTSKDNGDLLARLYQQD